MSEVAKRPPLSLREQAELLHRLTDRTMTRTGATAAETTMYVTAEDAEELRALAHRLDRMAPMERSIRQMVLKQ